MPFLIECQYVILATMKMKIKYFSQNFLLEEDKTINFAYQNIFNQIFNRLELFLRQNKI